MQGEKDLLADDLGEELPFRLVAEEILGVQGLADRQRGDEGLDQALHVAPRPRRDADDLQPDAAGRLGGVATSSEGEEPRRRVVIRPA